MANESRKLLQGSFGDWEVVVGLEVHAQVTSKSKLFSGASAEYGAGPNEHVSLVDAAMPGMLPVINKYCVEQAIRTGLGLNAKINLWSRFDRKNYFYPDLPQGYQISQYKDPIVGEGEIEVELDDGETIAVGVERLHLEQDAGKSIHDLAPKESYVDLNRSGVALMEIVSKPDMRSAEEGAAYFSKLRTIVRYLGTCDGNMEEGSMRADVNVSVRRPGEPLGTRTETKNVNSIRFAKQVIDYEARRQIEILEAGGTIDQETRLFDVKTGETRPMRSKEDAHDYRYFPDPDLLPLELDPEWVEEIKASLPELPDVTKLRYRDYFGVTPNISSDLALDIDIAKAFDEKVLDYVELKHGRPGRIAIDNAYGRGSVKRRKCLSPAELAQLLNAAEPYHPQMIESADSLASIIVGQVFAASNEKDIPAAQLIAELKLIELVELIKDGTISGRIAKDVFAIMLESGDDPAKIVEEKGLKQVTDTGAIEKILDDIIAANPKQVEQVKEKPKTFGWFVGQAMKASGGKANPQVVNALLKKKLGVE